MVLMFAVTAGTGEWTTMRIAGLVLTIVGDALLTIARFNLGNSFSVTAQAKKLVTNGIYSRVQHPVYVFSTLALAGLVLYFQQPMWMLALAVLIPVQVLRARKESRVLEEKFGDEYRVWKRRTWF
jgi:protein-S-isoprenylcysteine O-methyltransferase Ste14